MPDPVLVAVPDLIFRAKIAETARQCGREAVAATTPEAVLAKAKARRPGIVVVDLGDERVAPAATIRALKSDPETSAALVVGFFSHVMVAQKKAALEAGCDLVLPRSAFVVELPSLMASAGEEA